MIEIVMAAVAAPALGASGPMDVGRGVIAGALIVAASFMAGQAVLRRSGVAGYAFAMLVAAAGFLLVSLGLLPEIAARTQLLFLCLFMAAALLFIASAVRPVRGSAILGAAIFTGALTLAGIGVFTVFSPVDMSGIVRSSMIVTGLVSAALAGLFMSRDQGARIVLPGVVITLLSPALTLFSGNAFPIAAYGVFAVGVVAASLVALTEGASSRFRDLGLHAEPAAAPGPVVHAPAPKQDRIRASENQLAQVLDYSGVAVLDWSPDGAHQTDSLGVLLGADINAAFSPQALLAFIHKDDVAKFESRVLDSRGGDGAFDVVVRLHDQRPVRFRGARAVTSDGAIERLVAFVENAPEAARKPVSIFGGGAAPVATARAAASDPLTAAFAEALDKGEIVTVFQPIVALDTGKVAGFETLARWRNADGSERAGADELVRAAHAAGKQDALAALVLKNATDFLCDRIHADKKDIFVAMNVSIRQAQSPLFAEAVRALISDHKLKPKALVLELTETEALTDIEAATRAFRALAEAGAALALDDFGAGFSSLSHLKQFKFDYLKIDKQFIGDLTGDKGSGKIAKALASLAQDLGVAVIAEGVESKEMGDIARAAGCAFGQGYAYGGPATADALRAEASAAAPPAPVTSKASDISPALAALPAFGGEPSLAERAEVVILADDPPAPKADAKGKVGKAAKSGANEKPRRGLFGRAR